MFRIIMLAAVALSLPTAADAQQWSGCWVGSLGTGAQERRAVLELAAADDGWRGVLVTLSRSVSDDSLDALRISGDSIRFTAQAGPDEVAFAGHRSGGTIGGRLTRAGGEQPFALERVTVQPDPASRFIGYWSGWLMQGEAGVLRMGLAVAPAPCGQVIMTFDSPDQGGEDLPVTSLTVIGDSLHFEMAYLQGIFDGRRAGDSIVGDWRQATATLGVRLSRSDSVPVLARPQEPKPPFPYDTMAVTFENADAGVTLAGTLTLPPGDGPFPAAVLLTGSGPQDRDEALMGHKPFLVIADHLTRQGIAVLRYDDRGVGGSTGNLMNTTLEGNAADALAAVQTLQAHPKIVPDRVGLIGHSEGGWMAPIAASRSEDVAFIVMLAGPSVSGEEILYAQGRAMSEAVDAPEALIAGNTAVQRLIWPILLEEPNDSVARARILALVDTVLTRLPPDQAAALDSAWNAPGAAEQFEASLTSFFTPWFRDILGYEPAPVLRRVRVPALAIYGALDLQVPPSQSVPVLEALWADHPDATIRVFDDLNHLFQHAETGHLNEYARIEETFAPEVLDLMSSWMLERFGSR